MVRILKEDGKLGLLKGLITIEGTCSLVGRRKRRQLTSITSLTWPLRATTRCSASSAKIPLTPSTRGGPRVKEPQRRTTSSWMTRRIVGSSTA